MDPSQPGESTGQSGQQTYAYDQGQPQFGQLQPQQGQPPPTYGQAMQPIQTAQPPPQYAYDQPGMQPQNGQPLQQYGQPGIQAGVVVMQPQPQNTTIIMQGVVRPSSYLGLAIFTTFCCNLICGIIAIIFSIMSTSAADDGDMAQARTHGKVSMGLSIAGMLSTVIVIVVVLVYYFAIIGSYATSHNYDYYG